MIPMFANQIVRSVRRRAATFRNAESGSALLLITIMLPVFLGFATLAVDWSYVLVAQRELQTATDASALAGAQMITGSNTAGSVTTQAISYSSTTGSKNVKSYQNVSIASGYPKLRCLTSIGTSCTGTEGGNAVEVKQQATVPLYLAQAIGFGSVQISATSLAAKGGTSPPFDIMLVLDTTASMQQPDNKCSVPGASKLTCALTGVRAVLSQLDPAVDQVGLMVFPGLTSASQVPYEYCSPKKNITPAPYSASPVYKLIGLSSNPTAGSSPSADFRTSNTSGLNVNSNYVRAAAGDPSVCSGIQNPGGQGTYFADAINAAQAELQANGRPNVQNVIIFLSDGDATSSSVSSSKAKNECRQGVTGAQAAAAAGTWVYSIAYGAALSGCGTDTPAISPCATMQQIASDSAKFYSDGSAGCTSGGNTTSDLVSIFQHIAYTLTTARLVSANTQ